MWNNAIEYSNRMNNIKETYFALKRIVFGKHPRYFRPSPIERDYKRSYITRYFAKKTNSSDHSTIIEIDKEQFNSYGKKPHGIDDALYQIATLKWKISGPQNDVLDRSGSIIETGVSQTNARTLKRKDKEMRGISVYLGSLLEFWKDISINVPETEVITSTLIATPPSDRPTSVIRHSELV